MTHFDNRAPVSNQTGHQYIQGDLNIHTSHHSLPADTTPNYDFGLRLGSAPQINEEDFVGREGEIQQLQGWLAPRPNGQNVVALCGLGGMGKTQLSIQFVRKFGDHYSAVFWLNAKDENTIKAGLAGLAVEVGLDAGCTNRSVSDPQMEERMVQQARHWLSRRDNDKWLVIYDNYDDPRLPGLISSTGYDIRKFFPHRAQGSILITTRSSRIGFAKPLRLRKLEDVDEGLKILAARSEREVDGDPDAVKLVQRLDGLPLALATAGTYLSQTADSFSDYLQQYNSSWDELEEYSHGLLDYEDRTLFSTWNLSLTSIQNRDPAAAELLRLLAYLGNQDLWYGLFEAGAQDQPRWWSEVVKSRARFNQVMATLHDYSLIEVKAGSYRLHTCVHDWTLECLNREIDRGLIRLAVCCIAQSVKWNTEAEYWTTNCRVIQHAHRLRHARLQTLVDWNDIEPGALYRLAFLYEQLGSYSAAEEMYVRALRGFEQQGAEHESTLNTLNNLGILYADQGKMAQAEAMYIRALRGFEKAGAEHTSILDTVNNLGLLYDKQGKIAEAEAMYLRAIQGYEKAWGAEHTSTLNTVNNLSMLYSRQGRIAEAETMCLRALRGKEKAWGAEHTSTLNTVDNLGLIYNKQGRIAEAEAMYLRALQGFEKAWGAEHTSILNTVNNIGLLYDEQGRITEAEAMYLRAIQGYEKAWGAEHTSTLNTVNNLGVLYGKQGKIAEAEMMYMRALRGKEKAWGAEHTSTLDTVNNLGILYVHQGKMAEAEMMYLRALRGYEKVWGAEHTLTLDTGYNLGVLYEKQGRRAEAEAVYLRALRGYEKAWGADHMSTLATVNRLGLLYADQGEVAEAEAIYIRALRGYEKALGVNHQRTKGIARNLDLLHGTD